MTAEMVRERRNAGIPRDRVGFSLDRQSAVHVLDAGK